MEWHRGTSSAKIVADIYCMRLSEVFYEDGAAEWIAIYIGLYNDSIEVNATVQYNYSSEK